MAKKQANKTNTVSIPVYSGKENYEEKQRRVISTLQGSSGCYILAPKYNPSISLPGPHMTRKRSVTGNAEDEEGSHFRAPYSSYFQPRWTGAFDGSWYSWPLGVVESLKYCQQD